MDLNTIIENLKLGKYEEAICVYRDLELVISNCMLYNFNNFEIINKADSFKDSIKTDWGRVAFSRKCKR
jgi:hypothetical protein